MVTAKKNALVGLDIGSYAIKLVEIDQGKKGMMLKSFGLVGLPPDSIVEGYIKEREIVASAIKGLFKNLRVRNRNVATSVSGFPVIIKRITMASMKERELEATIQEEAEQYIPFDINEVNLDFDILAASDKSVESAEEQGERAEDTDRMEVTVVAAKKDIIDDQSNVLRAAGLNPGVLDVDAFALQNAFEISADESEAKGCFALVNVGAEELGINAIKNGASMFTRDSSYGGSQITKSIMSQFKVSFEEAEKIKLGGTNVEKEQAGQLEEIFSSVVSGWVREIKRALDFLATSYQDDTIEKILLAGGSCRCPGFRENLELETDIPVAELNPFENFIVDEKYFDAKYLEHMGPQAAVAVGLALRSVGDK
jgi:type IV pilus assembly protein PilM